jgi:hypothetical protein
MGIIKKELNVAELVKQLEKDEKLQFLFLSNYTPDNPNCGEYGKCKNGHFVFMSNSMGFQPNTHVKIQCEECDEIIMEFKPYAIRTRELELEESLPPVDTEILLPLSKVIKAIDDEPELPGEMPNEIWSAFKDNKYAVEELLRTIVRDTKREIIKRIKGNE